MAPISPSDCANIVQNFLKKNWAKGLLSTQNGPHHPQIAILLTIKKIKILLRPIQPTFWKLKQIEKKDQKSLA